MLGKTIGKYRVVDKIGRGGMGTVFKAVDETLDRDVAIKVLNPDLAETDVVKRFRAEAMTLARLSHPGIATIYELVLTDDDLLMVMEFVRGETFDRIVERHGSLVPPRAGSLCAQVLDALGHAHRVGIVHRDLKPANLMLTEYGAIKIMDFGIARVMGTEHLTSDGYMMGTPAYMAPEQVLAADVDARADLYSVGVVLYRLLTGKLPFQADTAIAMAHKQLKDPPTPLRQFRAELPDWCEDVLKRALAKSPADRFQTAEEFRDVLVGIGASLVPVVVAAAPIELTLPPDRPLPAAAVSTLPPPPAPAAAYAPTVPVVTPVEPRPPAKPAPGAAKAPTTPDRTTVVVRKRHLAVAAGVFTLLVLAVSGLAFVMNRSNTAPVAVASQTQVASPVPVPSPGETRPAEQAAARGARAGSANSAPAVSAPATQPTKQPIARGPAQPAPSSVPSAAPAKESTRPGARSDVVKATPPPVGARSSSASPPAAGPGNPSASEAAAAAARRRRAGRGMGLPPLTIADVKVLVADGSRQRERDATLTFAAGMLTVAEKHGAVIRTIPYEQILSVSYSRSRRPMWQSPGGPAPVLRMGGGAFGFFRADPHWLSVRTKEAFLVLRVEPAHTRSVPAAFADRAGVAVDIVREKARPTRPDP
jgi:serine/threonine-protein kinase